MSLSIEKTPNPSDTPTFVKIKYDNLEVALEWIRDISQAINDRLLREGGGRSVVSWLRRLECKKL